LEHLRVLSLQIAPSYPSNTELLSDIKQTYQWLEKYKEDAALGHRLVQYHTEPLFLNIDDPECMDWTWHSASKMYINISDSPASDCWGVRQFLIPFRGLLRLAGVKEVQMRTAPDMPISSLEQQLNHLQLMRNAYDSMRREGKLTDVIFITDDGEEFPAHRVVLAGAGEHFRDLFLGQWGESNLIVDRPISVPECPADCLRWILGEYLNPLENFTWLMQITEYLYTGVIPVTEEKDMLLHILHLAHRWELSSLFEVMQARLVMHISLDTYDTRRSFHILIGISGCSCKDISTRRGGRIGCPDACGAMRHIREGQSRPNQKVQRPLTSTIICRSSWNLFI
jgi:sacsin